MNVSPLDLKQQWFNTTMRGFDKVEVTSFLLAVADDYEQALREADRLRQDVARLEAAAKSAQSGKSVNSSPSASDAGQQIGAVDPPTDSSELAAERAKLKEAQETWDRAEAFRQETGEIERRAKYLPEAARRLLQAECRLLPNGKLRRVEDDHERPAKRSRCH